MIPWLLHLVCLRPLHECTGPRTRRLPHARVLLLLLHMLLQLLLLLMLLLPLLMLLMLLLRLLLLLPLPLLPLLLPSRRDLDEGSCRCSPPSPPEKRRSSRPHSGVVSLSGRSATYATLSSSRDHDAPPSPNQAPA